MKKMLTRGALGALAFVMMSGLAQADSRPFKGRELYAPAWNEQYTRLAKSCEGLEPEECAMLKKLTSMPRAYWVGVSDIATELLQLRVILSEAQRSGEVPTIVVYRIPNRDCGRYARLNEGITPNEYKQWLWQVAGVFHEYSDVPVNILIEPDALADVVTARDQLCEGRDKQEVLAERLYLIREAIWNFTSSNSRIFVDTGNSVWLDAPDEQATMAAALVNLLQDAAFHGIGVNVANYYSFEQSLWWGKAITLLVYADTGEELSLAIDISRSGNSVEQEAGWCNPRGAALDPVLPTLSHPDPAVELATIFKIPGESDGEGEDCNGGPPAGAFCFSCLKDYLAHSAAIHD